MGSMKELLFEMQEERRDEWIAENYPDAEEGTPEWDAAAQEYSWFQDWMEEAAEQQYFEARLPVFLTACRMQRLNWMS